MVSLNGNDRASGEIAVTCIRSRMKPGTVAIYCGDNQINPHVLNGTVELSKSDGAGSERGINGLIVSDLMEEVANR
jgi:hypothetical protein